jgi:high-affinity iron transporter
MLQSVVVTFREGLEAFLIVGIIVAYLRKTGRHPLLKGVLAGIALAVGLSTVGAYFWWQAFDAGADFNQALWEGIAALVAAALVGVFLWQIQRVGRALKGQIEGRVEAAAQLGAAAGSGRPPTLVAQVAVALVTALFVARELVEALFVLGARAMAGSAGMVVLGSAIGLGLAASYAGLWSRYGHRMQLGVVLRATAIFLAFFLVQLVLWGVHELAESGVFTGSQAFHDATERLGPEGDIGGVFAFVVAAIPLLVVAWTIVRMFISNRGTPSATPGTPSISAGSTPT